MWGEVFSHDDLLVADVRYRDFRIECNRMAMLDRSIARMDTLSISRVGGSVKMKSPGAEWGIPMLWYSKSSLPESGT
ncbi:hypothetical protein AMJ82_01760 [candidate division TA06 bacterium SM23_40]|uniref:Uncharacterized protein n=1 Tax=candidate division TA06 bacterium SM23_40 TaxID=1703774 RepID=A0A0S8GEN6_UNCT6|nr:MAG: hypothetical protein AMJ82_01760 [candidate division TA06 bacterium SM23_40]